MAIAAKTRVKHRLRATTTLDPASTLSIVKKSAANVKGGGASVVTSGIYNIGANIIVVGESPDGLAMKITSGKQIVQLCTFSARAKQTNGKTTLTVGGLEQYKTNQSKLFIFIPLGPKRILGFDPYKRFLAALEAELRSADSSVEIEIGIPAAA